MNVSATLRRVTDGVCASIERAWVGRVPGRFPVPRYALEPLERRQLLSVAANISGPAQVTEGDAYVLSLTASSTASTYSVQNWAISYGDGTTHTLFGDSVADLYTYNTPSSPTYHITATVIDTEGGATYSGSTSLDVTVGAATPSLYLSPQSDTAAVGQPFQVYQDLADGGDHMVATYSIAWGDGGTDSDATMPQTITGGYADAFTHTYASTGTYDVTATAVTEQGTLTATTSVAAIPLAVAAPTSGYVAGAEYDLTPTFDDPGHTLGGYVVSWGDGTADTTFAASAVSFGHTYAAGGANPYEATVRAIADDGTWTASAQASPLAAVWSDAPANRGDTVYLDGAFDANGDTPTAWIVSWGDGTTATYAGSDQFGSNNDYGGPLDATHSYAADGTFTVTATALDATGSYAAQDGTYTISEPTPTFSVAGNDTFTEHQAYALTPSFSISSGDTPNSYVVDWGDGSPAATYAGASTALSHTFTAGAGAPYTVEAIVTTDFGTYTSSTSVDMAQPSVSISGPNSVTAGQTATFTTSFDDPNGNTPTGWTVYWGDGDEGESVSGNPGSLTHVYTSSPEGDGDWTVAAMASDADGGFWADDATVAVTNETPSVSVTGDTFVMAGVAYNPTLSFTDPAGRAPYDWLINWGDEPGEYFYDGADPAPSHEYTHIGSFEIAATAVVAAADPAATANLSYAASATVTVRSDPSATLSFDLYANDEGAHSEIHAHFASADGATVTSYEVDWGDGDRESYVDNPDYQGTFGHTYTQASGPGGDTITVTAFTSDGMEYEATQTAVISPASPGLVLAESPYTSDGQGYSVIPYFQYDLAGNDTSVFPVPGHPVTYTVDWGDGNTRTYSQAPLTTVYVYRDPNIYPDGYDFTVVANTDEYTQAAAAHVDVQPAGGGQLSIGAVPSDITEGLATAFAAGFTDSNQTGVNGDIGARWGVWWGDGSSSDGDFLGLGNERSYHPTHAYAEPGTYEVTFGAEYNEDDGSGHIAIANPVTVTVAEATPTLTVEASTDILAVGDAYVLAPTYTDTAGDHVPNVLTVDWGDGDANVYAGGGNPPSGLTHVYTTTGPFEPTLSLSAFADDGHITATAPQVNVVGPTVGIAAGQQTTADEAGQRPADFLVTRSTGGVDAPLVVGYSLGGTLDATAYVVTGADGRILDGSVTIPAGQSSAEILVYPLEDHTPRWTETVDIALASGGTTYGLDPTASAAGCYVVNDDLYAWLDNGSDNEILQGDGGQYTQGRSLVPLVLDLPTEQRDGAVITLTDGAPNNANVWLHQTPSTGEQPILGVVNGTAVSEVTWTYDTDPDAPSGKTTLWVEPTNGTPDLNAISFEVHDDDSGCGSSGTNSDPTVPQNPSTQPATANSDGSNSISGNSLQILMLNDPNNSGLANHDIAGNAVPIPWLIGQMVDVEAMVVGPRGQNAKFSWDVLGNTLYRYTMTTQRTTPVPLAPDNGAIGHRPGGTLRVGTSQPEVQFFWVSTSSNDPNNPDIQPVTVDATFADGMKLQASTAFAVTTPASHVQVWSADPGIFYSVKHSGWRLGLGSSSPGVDGITWLGSVQTPAWVNTTGTGSFEFVQLVKPDTLRVDSDSISWVDSKQGVWVLDGNLPYGGPFAANGLANTEVGDSPAMPIDAATTKSAREAGAFQTFIMYLPPGASSQWVPASVENWSFGVSVKNNGGVWSPDGPKAKVVPPFAPATSEPDWSDFVPPGGAKDVPLQN